MITQREISQFAHRLEIGDKVIEKDYVLTWLLMALAGSELNKYLAFKGGTALKKIYFPDYRFSEDLDFTLTKEIDANELISKFENMLNKLTKDQAFQFILPRDKIEKRTNSITLYVNYVGPLNAAITTRDIKVDFTIDEKLIFPIEKLEIHSDYSDATEKKILTYSLEEILTEKLCALIGRTEPRDLYDTHFLLNRGDLDYYAIKQSFIEKADSKKVDHDRLEEVLNKREVTFGKLWDTRLKHQIRDLPDFEGIVRVTRKFFRKYDII